MSIYPLHPEIDAILSIILYAPGISTQELLSQLQARGIQTSKPNVYKKIQKLVEKQVCVKKGEKIYMSTVWLSAAQRTLNDGLQNIAGVHTEVSMLKDGESIIRKSDSLIMLDPIWNELLHAMIEASKRKQLYAYNSHQWHMLGNTEQELRWLTHASRITNLQFFIGNKTPLDIYAEKLMKDHKLCVTTLQDAPFPSKGYALWLCGDFILEVFFPEMLQQYFGLLYDTTQAIESLNKDTFKALFSMKQAVQVRVKKNKKEAMKLHSIFSGLSAADNSNT